MFRQEPTNAETNVQRRVDDLALQNKEKAKAQRKKKEMKSCGCCPVDPSEDA